MKTCKYYVGVTCVNGSCPRAYAEIYKERGMDAIHSCEECSSYRGCEDCGGNEEGTCTFGGDMNEVQQYRLQS